MSVPRVKRLAVIGAGLIGSSLARAVREKHLAETLVVADRDPAVRRRVMELGFADEVPATAAEAARDADMVIACVPVGASRAIAAEVGPELKPGAILSDVGSVKGAVLEAMAPHVPAHAHLVPAHPVAGTEFSGPDAGFASLFENRWCIVTPPEGADPEAVEKLATLWRGMGANVEFMSAQHHDLVLAITSHVPHLIAYNIVGTAAELEETLASEVIKFSAGGFRDFTRIASSDPTMWRDVFLYNRDAVLEMLGRFTEDLTALQRAIRYGDGDTLFAHFTRTRAIRRSIIEQGQETAAPDFGRRAAEKPKHEQS
ncbi:prephenate/arogenate dehydrogenase family protein [Xanthobacter agilis]|uniref:Cyclohexadieny/prephenate dehydrogenase n=1 Tax=Xanthobacter agilis TaxID=47492 RepID=A0ABU0LFG5_XANAG|nr:prephenate/arogenate dehydrogenase family protein [Xanthobacter agilis]MDQ0505885.1 cyclohexadieny/prephenate dehydrogenase [Xanthobacter agilis]